MIPPIFVIGTLLCTLNQIKMIPKDKRIKIYEEILSILNDDRDVKESGILGVGLCFLLRYSVGGRIYRSISEFPELTRHKPKDNFQDTGYWFNPDSQEGTNKRRKILEDAIENPIED